MNMPGHGRSLYHYTVIYHTTVQSFLTTRHPVQQLPSHLTAVDIVLAMLSGERFQRR